MGKRKKKRGAQRATSLIPSHTLARQRERERERETEKEKEDGRRRE